MPIKVKPDTGGMLPTGGQTVEITKATVGTNDNSGNPELKIELKDRDGRWLSAWLYPTERAMWKLRELWEAAALPWPEQGGEIDEADLVGRKVHAEVYEDFYNGQARLKVKEFSLPLGSDVPSDGFESTPVPDDDSSPF